jgi:hypothetical protein
MNVNELKILHFFLTNVKKVFNCLKLYFYIEVVEFLLKILRLKSKTKDFNHVLLTTLCTDLQNDFPHVTYLEGDTVPGAVLIILLENSLHFC